jgi:Ala-tRNA(Pro) deacylase
VEWLAALTVFPAAKPADFGGWAMNVEKYLDEHKVAFDVIRHNETFDAQRLAEVLKVPGREVAKTVLLRADRGYAYLLAVVPAPENVDLHRVGELLGGSHIELATELEVYDVCPDCEPGVVPPFGSRYGMKTLVDDTLVGDEQIVFEGNSHRDAIRMRFEDFRQLEQPFIGKLTAGRA